MASLGAQVRTWLTGVLKAGTAPIRGEVVLFDTTSNSNEMIICGTADSPKFAGIVYDPPAVVNNTAVGQTMRVVRSGICLCKVSATAVTQCDMVTTTNAGRILPVSAAVTSTHLYIGMALESGAAADLIAVDVNPIVIKFT